MKKVLAFGASNSRHSINKKLATYTSSHLENIEVTILDLNDFEMPIYGIDKEKATGIPQLAHDFKAFVKATDGIIISFAEHNGAYTTAFKNIFDWISRIEKSPWDNKPMLLLATSPGGRGGKSVLDIAYTRFSYTNDNIALRFSLPFFDKNFDDNQGITDETLKETLLTTLKEFEQAL